MNFLNQFFTLKVGDGIFCSNLSYVPYLGFWYFWGICFKFLGLVFGLFEFSKYFSNLLKKLCRVYFLHFVKIIHHLGFWYFGALF